MWVRILSGRVKRTQPKSALTEHGVMFNSFRFLGLLILTWYKDYFSNGVLLLDITIRTSFWTSASFLLIASDHIYLYSRFATRPPINLPNICCFNSSWQPLVQHAKPFNKLLPMHAQHLPYIRGWSALRPHSLRQRVLHRDLHNSVRGPYLPGNLLSNMDFHVRHDRRSATRDHRLRQ